MKTLLAVAALAFAEIPLQTPAAEPAPVTTDADMTDRAVALAYGSPADQAVTIASMPDMEVPE